MRKVGSNIYSVSTVCKNTKQNKTKQKTHIGDLHMSRLTWLISFYISARSLIWSPWQSLFCQEIFMLELWRPQYKLVSFSLGLQLANFTFYWVFMISFYNAIYFPKILYYFNSWPVECVYFRANYLMTYLIHIYGIGNKGTFKWCLRRK